MSASLKKAMPHLKGLVPTRIKWLVGYAIPGKWLDLKLGIDTQDWRPRSFHTRACADGTSYQPVTKLEMEKVLDYVTHEDTFVDVGCGKGRVVCFVASKVACQGVIGIEIDSALAAIAQQNAVRTNARTPIRIVQEDAASMSDNQGTVYFLFNPFGERTLQKFLDRLSASLKEAPRDVCILYINPVYAHLLDKTEWLVPGESVTIGANPNRMRVYRTIMANGQNSSADTSHG